MKNFLRNFRTTAAGTIFGGGFAGQALYNWLQGGTLDTKQLISGFAILALGVLAKDAQVAGVATQEAK
jgi:hypothetical protein